MEAGHLGGGGDDNEDDDDELLREWSRRLVAAERVEAELEEGDTSAAARGNLDALHHRQVGGWRQAAAVLDHPAGPPASGRRSASPREFSSLTSSLLPLLLFQPQPLNLASPLSTCLPPPACLPAAVCRRSLTAAPPSAGWPTSWARCSRRRISTWWPRPAGRRTASSSGRSRWAASGRTPTWPRCGLGRRRGGGGGGLSCSRQPGRRVCLCEPLRRLLCLSPTLNGLRPCPCPLTLPPPAP